MASIILAAKVKDIKPLLSASLDEAIDLLRSGPVPDEDAVHEIRVLMKKSRALMKLVSGQIGEVCYERNMQAFRETGRMLSGLRETSVHRRTLKQLRKNYPGIFRSLAANDKLMSLLSSDRIVRVKNGNSLPVTDNILALLEKSRFRLRFESMSGLNVSLLYEKLEAHYGEVSALYLQCRNNPGPRRLHEFRKRAKDLLYQAAVFRSLNPARVRKVEKLLDSITLNLGKYRDYNQVIKALGYKYDPDRPVDQLDGLIAIIRNRQDKCLMKVWEGAYEVFRPGQQLSKLLGFSFSSPGQTDI